MIRISFKYTKISKCISGMLYFVLTTLFIGVNGYDRIVKESGPSYSLLFFCSAFLIFCFKIFRDNIWSRVDEAYDCGSYILIRHNQKEEQIPFTKIEDVDVLVGSLRLILKKEGDQKEARIIMIEPQMSLTSVPHLNGLKDRLNQQDINN